MTAQELKFINLIAKGFSGVSAYRQAYPGKAKLKYETIRFNASKLLTDSNIAQEIETSKARQIKLARLAEDRIEEQLIRGQMNKTTADVAMFMYEQANGKATQKIESKGAFVSVTYDLSGGQAEKIPKNILDQLTDVPPPSTP